MCGVVGCKEECFGGAGDVRAFGASCFGLDEGLGGRVFWLEVSGPADWSLYWQPVATQFICYAKIQALRAIKHCVLQTLFSLRAYYT